MTSTPEQSSTTHFGYKTVPSEKKAANVRAVFDEVASNYDRMNDAMSLGLHRLWKDRFVQNLQHLNSESHVLDVAGGTGDIAARLHKKTGATITVLDINEAMLRAGLSRQEHSDKKHAFRYVCGNAECLPLPDNSQDLYTIAFGLRNVTHIDKALREAYRVLKPGGQFRCLEFSPVNTPVIKQIYDAYSFHIIPRLGEKLAGTRDAYQYLAESIRMFPRAEKLALMMRNAGFDKANFYHMNLGVVAVHTGVKF